MKIYIFFSIFFSVNKSWINKIKSSSNQKDIQKRKGERDGRNYLKVEMKIDYKTISSFENKNQSSVWWRFPFYLELEEKMNKEIVKVKSNVLTIVEKWKESIKEIKPQNDYSRKFDQNGSQQPWLDWHQCSGMFIILT